MLQLAITCLIIALIEVDPIIRTTGGPALDSGRRSFSTPWAIDFPRCLIT